MCAGAVVVLVAAASTVLLFDDTAAPKTAAAGGHASSAARHHRVDPSTLPSASPANGSPLVGPLFSSGLNNNHSCTASVVDSATGDTILTAAHCLRGTGKGILFAPGYSTGATPYGVWTVTGAYLEAGWLDRQAPADDYAVLTVADRRIDGVERSLDSVTGAETVGTTPADGARITVLAYNDGRDDRSTTCTVPMVSRHGHPTFYCHGFVSGSSGSPWLLASTDGQRSPTVVGLIGGRHQGGCVDFTSHSAPFTPAVAELVARAARGASPDTAPVAGSDNCPADPS